MSAGADRWRARTTPTRRRPIRRAMFAGLAMLVVVVVVVPLLLALLLYASRGLL